MSERARFRPWMEPTVALVLLAALFGAAAARPGGSVPPVPQKAAAQADTLAAPWVDSVVAPYFFAVSVADLDGAVAWYRRALGLRLLDDSRADDGRWRIINLTDDRIFVELIVDARDAAPVRSRGIRKIGFAVEDVGLVAARVEEATGERPRIVEIPAHGLRVLQLRDPEGNVLQLSSPLAPPAPTE